MARGPAEPLYHYCVIRTDLTLGQICAQLIHAAGESAGGKLPPSTHAVALAAHDEKELLALEVRLRAEGILHAAIREPDLNGALTAIGVRPVPRVRLKHILKKFPLLSETTKGDRHAA